MKKLNVVSCFDGMSCGQESLKQLGIPVGKYYSSELDKYAIAVTQHNHPDTIQVGDITNWREWDIDWSSIDLIFGGSPCQGFSFAGKQLAFDDPRSKLFFVFVEIINHIKKVNPNVKFLLENVRMKQEYLDIISEHIGVQPVKINSALVSAQNRVRYYWTNIEGVEQPKDRGILLKDVLETNVDKDFTLKENDLKTLNRDFGSKGKDQTGKDKSCCIVASIGTGGGNYPYINSSEDVGGAMRGRYLVNGKRADHTVDSMAGKTEQRIETRTDGKMNCLTSVSKDSIVVNRCIEVGKADLKGHDYIKRVYSPEGKAPTLNANGGGNLEPKVAIENKTQNKEGKSYCITARYDGAVAWNSIEKKQRTMIPTGNSDISKNDYKSWRKLTPLECERLQTVPDNYTLVPWQKRMMSNSQRYKMLGNGWTIEVIKHIFKNLHNT